MTFAEGALRFILGGTLVLLIGIIAKSGKSTAAGIVAMLPIITAVSFTFLARSEELKIVKEAVLSSIISLPATLIFLAVFYFCIGRWNIICSLGISLLAWLGTAVLVYIVRA